MNLTYYDQKGNQTDAGIYWKCGSIFGILSADVFPLIDPERTFLLKKGVIFQDFYVPFIDWKRIRSTDLWIAGWNHPLVLGHLSLWNKELPVNTKKPIAANVDAYEELRSQLDAEFILRMAALLDETAQKYLKNLPPESTEKYSLEGILRSVHQEMTSPLLKDRMEKIKTVKLALFSDLMKHEDPFSHEKELVRERHALEENLEALVEVTGQLKDEFEGFASFQVLASSKNWEEREKALGRLAKLFSLQIVLIGNPLEKEVREAIALLQES